jgi:hypothetical protein
MKTSLTSRLLTAIVAISSMLFMQLAVAAYACPEILSGSQNNVTSATAMAGDMANCDGMDPAQPALCHSYVHGEAAKQSLDKNPVPNVPPFVPAALMLTLQVVDVALPALQTYRPIALTRTSSPPIAIRNCCFRI